MDILKGNNREHGFISVDYSSNEKLLKYCEFRFEKMKKEFLEELDKGEFDSLIRQLFDPKLLGD